MMDRLPVSCHKKQPWRFHKIGQISQRPVSRPELAIATKPYKRLMNYGCFRCKIKVQEQLAGDQIIEF